MLNSGHRAEGADTQAAWFATTHWSVVLSASQSADPQASEALEHLRAECASDARSGLFEQLQGFVTGEKRPVSYAEAAANLDLSLSAVKSAIFRLRRRYHELVRDEVGHTVAEPAEGEGELRYMLEVFSRGP